MGIRERPFQSDHGTDVSDTGASTAWPADERIADATLPFDRSMPAPPENGAKTAPFSWNTCNFRRIATLLADMLFVHMRLDRNEAILGGQSHVSARRLTVDRDRYGPATPRGKRSLGLGVGHA